MTYNFIQNPCVRIDSITPDERHPCFVCGNFINVGTSDRCTNCGLFVCPICKCCYCDLTETNKQVLQRIHITYCRNLCNLFNFSETIDTALPGIQGALELCSKAVHKNLKINIGCGMDLKRGYMNIDTQNISHPDDVLFVQADCGNLSFLEDKTVIEIYARGLVEHIHPLNLKEYLYEWQRVLKVGGKLILIFPDFEKIVFLYKKCWSLQSTDELMEFLDLNYAVLNTNQRNDLVRGDRHRCLVTPIFLRIMLQSEGFGNLEFSDYGSKKESQYTTKLEAIKVRED